MLYQIESEYFFLEMEPRVFEDELDYANNSDITIAVSSYNYSAKGKIETSARDIYAFATELKKVYDTLTGIARLQEPYGFKNYIEFKALPKGHIAVSGRIVDTTGCFVQEIKFENEIDQTYLRSFAFSLVKDFEKYATSNLSV